MTKVNPVYPVRFFFHPANKRSNAVTKIINGALNVIERSSIGIFIKSTGIPTPIIILNTLLPSTVPIIKPISPIIIFLNFFCF